LQGNNKSMVMVCNHLRWEMIFALLIFVEKLNITLCL
jgi:hypothetical protein